MSVLLVKGPYFIVLPVVGSYYSAFGKKKRQINPKLSGFCSSLPFLYTDESFSVEHGEKPASCSSRAASLPLRNPFSLHFCF